MHFITVFKNLRHAQIDLDRPFTLLIGRNGAGKSNVVEAIELLAQFAKGRQLHEVTDAGRGGGFQVRGGLRGCFGHEVGGLQLGVRRASDEYEVSITANGQVHLESERLELGDRVAYVASESSSPGLVDVQFDNFDRGPNKPTTPRPADRSVLSQYEALPIARPSKVFEDALASIQSLRAYLQSSFVFDPEPRSMRTYERIGDDVLAGDGGNLSAVLYSLADTKRDGGRAALDRLASWVRQLPEEPFSHFDFVVTDLNDVIFGLRTEGSKELVDAKVLSDGTLRCLAILTALETVESGSRVVIEEFDNSVNPSRIDVLTSAVHDCAVRRKLNVLCTTHNPATLNGLTPEQLGKWLESLP